MLHFGHFVGDAGLVGAFTRESMVNESMVTGNSGA